MVKFKKGDKIFLKKMYYPFPKGSEGRVLDVNEENQLLNVQLKKVDKEDPESGIFIHPFDFFSKKKIAA
ncbi:hypothetical protein [Xanthovirga aplysinae]|uniref:hypothetical protein n=1 Tax=Xanthovirga aplysinae TaxID=2529853 RepID=UPI0012BC9023|nr:hypothetical protein [Xanthovirga aplysinae]MTI31936.1 hypothetical protein [Xanthovirga aplysinae]